MARMTGVRIYVLKFIRRVPEGSVITVPDLARAADARGARRAMIRIVAERPEDTPYWRVVNEDGSLLELDEQFRDEQRERLSEEGVELEGDRVDLDACGWTPQLE